MQGRADWARGIRGCLTWGIPAAILLISPTVGTRYLVIVWPALLTVMGAACLLNARRCASSGQFEALGDYQGDQRRRECGLRLFKA